MNGKDAACEKSVYQLSQYLASDNLKDIPKNFLLEYDTFGYAHANTGTYDLAQMLAQLESNNIPYRLKQDHLDKRYADYEINY